MATMKNIDEVRKRLVDLQNQSTEAEATSSKAVSMMEHMAENLATPIQVMITDQISIYCIQKFHSKMLL